MTRTTAAVSSLHLLTYEAVLFDLDGVLTQTAALHASCWKQTFDDFLDAWGRSTGTCPEPFDAESDYLAHVDGKLRDDGVRDFLRARPRGPRPPDPALRRATQTHPRRAAEPADAPHGAGGPPKCCLMQRPEERP